MRGRPEAATAGPPTHSSARWRVRRLTVCWRRVAFCAGPTEESNWVLPGRVLVGAYPSSLEDKLNAEILTSILRLGACAREGTAPPGAGLTDEHSCSLLFAAGVTTFVCLQQGGVV